MKARATLASVALVIAGMAPATAATIGDEAGPASPVRYMPPAGIMSDNVSYVGTIPIEAIGGRVVKVGNQTRFYVSGAPGLVIYDITNPALPVVLGGMPLPHFQNEDMDVSDDGSRVVISTDTAHAGSNGSSVAAGGGSLRVIDTSNPMTPRVVGYLAEGNHTATCADPKCEWIYGSGGGIYDARDPAQLKRVASVPGGGGHAFNRDATGLLISDSNPRRVLNPLENPQNPVILTDGRTATRFSPDGLLQHNNVRPNADQWVSRPAPQTPDEEFPLRPGELLIGNSESNVRTTCGGNAGGLSSWSMAGFDQGAKLEQIQSFRPVNGNWVDGNPAVNALGCSGHWFTVRNNMIAAAWYEHGIKFIEIDPGTGKFTQKGYFQPVVTEAGAAHWVTDAAGNEYVYTTDYARGIDILRYSRAAEAPSQQELYESWVWNLENTMTARPSASAERYACRLAMEGGYKVG